MLDTSPGKVGNVDQAVNAAEVNKYTVGGNIFNHSFEYLSFFEFRNNFLFLLFQLFFNKGFVGNNYILEFRIDFYHLEFHCFVNKDIVVADRFHIDLRTRQERFDTEYIHNHTAFCTAFDVSFDYFVVF